MRLLLVDAGNARLKWALLEADALATVHHAEYGRDAQQSIAEMCRHAAEADAVAVSNVRGAAFDAALREALVGFAGEIWFARSTRVCGRLRNGYVDPSSLGVDRWAAMIGAFERSQSENRNAPLCVVDAGTALTIDAIRSDGQHLGGLILPGLQMQRQGLLESTADIAVRAAGRAGGDADSLFARDTSAALARSGAIAGAAVVDRYANELHVSESPAPVTMLTGGDAEALAPWLATGFEICPNLVLEGLAVLFRQRSSN